MKHFNALTDIETQIIRLEVFESLLRTVASGIPYTNLTDAENSIWSLQGMVEDIHKNIRNSFDILWNTLSEEETKELTQKLEKKKK